MTLPGIPRPSPPQFQRAEAAERTLDGENRDGMLYARGDWAVPVSRSGSPGCLSCFPIWISTHHQPLTMCKCIYMILTT